MRCRRKEAQPSGIKTFGSTFVNPDDLRAEGLSAGQLLDDAGCSGLAVGGARLSPKHANFVENAGDATTADILAVMAEARRRVHDRFGSDPGARGPGPREGELAGGIATGADRKAAPRRAETGRRIRARGPVVRRRLVAAGVIALALYAGYMLWFRNLSWFSIDEVTVEGATTSERKIKAAVEAAATDMTTLHLKDDDLAAAVSRFPTVAAIAADASFPQSSR